MYCAIDGRSVMVREASGKMVRRFSVSSPVVGAQVNGDNVVIQCSDGWTYLYKTSGTLIRKTKG